MLYHKIITRRRGGGGGQPVFNPANLFLASPPGAFYESKPEFLFQDSAGTVPVTVAGDPAGRMIDQSGNVQHAIQTSSAQRLVYNVTPSRLTLDKVDDALVITVPTGGWTGTMVLATDSGTASYGVNIPAGAYNLGGQYFSGTSIVGAVFRDGALSAGDSADTEAYFVGNGATASYGAITNFSSYWRGRSELTEFPLINTSQGTNFTYTWFICNSLTSFPLIDTSSGNNFVSAWYLCSSLTSFPLIDTSSGSDFNSTWRSCSSLASFPLIDTSSGTSFSFTWFGCSSLASFPLLDFSNGTTFMYAWSDCTSLTSFPANAFDNIKGGSFNNAFTNTNLNQASIDGILVSLVASGIAADTRGFNQSGGSAPSVGVGQPAIDTLRSRGWVVTVTGGY